MAWAGYSRRRGFHSFPASTRFLRRRTPFDPLRTPLDGPRTLLVHPRTITVHLRTVFARWRSALVRGRMAFVHGRTRLVAGAAGPAFGDFPDAQFTRPGRGDDAHERRAEPTLPARRVRISSAPPRLSVSFFPNSKEVSRRGAEARRRESNAREADPRRCVADAPLMRGLPVSSAACPPPQRATPP